MSHPGNVRFLGFVKVCVFPQIAVFAKYFVFSFITYKVWFKDLGLRKGLTFCSAIIKRRAIAQNINRKSQMHFKTRMNFNCDDSFKEAVTQLKYDFLHDIFYR